VSTPERLWHMPDWDRGVQITHFWETLIQRDLNMGEERQSVADQKRVKIAYRTKTMEALESQQLRAFIRGLNEQRLRTGTGRAVTRFSGAAGSAVKCSR